MNARNAVTDLSNGGSIEIIKNVPSIWNEIDHFVKLRIAAAILSRNPDRVLVGFIVAEKVANSYQMVGALSCHDVFNSFTNKSFHICMELYGKHGLQKTPESFRRFIEYELEPCLDECQERILKKFERYLIPGSEYCPEIQKEFEDVKLAAKECKKQWFQKYEIKARELEHAFTTNGGTLIGHSKSLQIDAPISESKALLTIPGDRYMFHVDGAAAIVKYEGQEIRGLQATKGIRLLAFLVANQGQEYDSPLTLDYAFEGVPLVPDGMKKGETPCAEDGFRSSFKVRHNESGDQLHPIYLRIIEIDSEIKAAQDIGQAWRIEPLEEEKDQILKHFRDIKERLSRISDWDPESKKVVNKYRNSLKRALGDIKNQSNGGPLAQHFKQALYPFVFPWSYKPSPAIDWQI